MGATLPCLPETLLEGAKTHSSPRARQGWGSSLETPDPLCRGVQPQGQQHVHRLLLETSANEGFALGATAPAPRAAETRLRPICRFEKLLFCLSLEEGASKSNPKYVAGLELKTLV